MNGLALLTSIGKLFEVQLDSSDVLLCYSSAHDQDATNVLWIDIQTNTTHFQSLFSYLLMDIASVPEKLKKIPLQESLPRGAFLFRRMWRKRC
ncbi:hypothetical protein L6452_37641 [Arctium lappa]|uniref:Uncharacterized protein n=1 Tax=Arctium lappa TaxID=4217 RepID=A0ACB8Y417_ARCLA|nr:hypothetical protein L6452_37641 [Arctium lappa]